MSTYESEPQHDVAVIGAGVIGLSCALWLQQAGRSVTLFDSSGPGSGSSWGTAGLINGDAHLPVAIPGMLRRVPRWLLDPHGPVRVRPGYLPRALPWLTRWVLASRGSVARQGARALHALHRGVFDGYRTILGQGHFDTLLRQSGGVVLADGEQPGPDELFANKVRAELGLECEVLGPDRLQEIFPGMAPHVRRGLLFPNNGYTLAPNRLVAAMFERFQAGGGTLRLEKVLRISPEEGGGGRLLTNQANVRARAIVSAAGAWSRTLLDPLGLRLPLETERGYHLQLGTPSIPIALPMIYRARGLAITPMEEGLRLAGTVEIAGLEAPPDESRALVLRRHLEELFPGIQVAQKRLWMGYRPSLPDSVAAIGRAPGHPWLFVAVGHGHDGMIGAPSTGRLIAELVTGAPPHVEPAPYALTRFVRG